MRHPLIKLFHLSILLHINRGAWQATVLRVTKSGTWLRRLSTHARMPNDSRMVDDEFLDNFSRSCKRISFDDGSQLVVVNFRWWPLPSSSSRLSSPLLSSLLNHHCTECSLAVLGPNVLIMQVVSTALWPILNSNNKITWIFFLSNIISKSKINIKYKASNVISKNKKKSKKLALKWYIT